MTLNPFLKSLMVVPILLILFPSCCLSAAEVNELFVRRNLEKYFTETLRMFPALPSSDIYLDYEPPAGDNLNISGAALGVALSSKGIKRIAAVDSESQVGLRFRLSEITLSYENSGGNIFSRGDLYRVLTVAGSFSLLQDKSSIWDDYLVRKYREEIELSEKSALESDSSPLFHAELPPGPVQKIWEPVIVTSIIGGMVYLFFASR